MNLVNMAMKYVGPMVAERIASKMGVGGPVVNKLIAAALPAILGSLIGKSKTGSGLGSIMDMITGPNRPEPGGLASMFEGGGDVDALTKSGGGMLEGLLGGNGLSALAGALGSHAGVDKDQAGSILGMLAPVALGSLGDQVAEQGLDGPGLANFLDGQAGNVAQAMPAGFASQLDGSGLFDGISANLSGGIDAAKTAASGAAASAASAASNAQAEVKQGMGMLPKIIGVLAIAALAWYFLGGKDVPEVDTSAMTGQEFVVGDVNIGEEFSNVTGSLTETFQGITDTASAEAALPQLGELSDKIGSLGEVSGQLPGPAKTAFQGIVSTALSALRPVIEGAIASSGAGAILQPIADQILGAMEGMAG